jgi:hypothetical protein
MMADLQIDISHHAASELSDMLRERGIAFEDRTPRPKPGVIFASGNDILSLIGNATPWGALAAIVITWIRARSRRKVICTTQDHKVVHIQIDNMSAEDVEHILQSTRRVTMVDPDKPEAKRPEPPQG